MQIPNKRRKKPPGAPKRAMSAFLSYSKLMRPTIRVLYPDLKNTDISGVLAQHWKSASEEDKKPHVDREIMEREKYHEDMAKWKKEVGGMVEGTAVQEDGDEDAADGDTVVMNESEYGINFFNSMWSERIRFIYIISLIDLS